MRLSAFTCLTFDCYGTLIDWERGIVAALTPWLAAHRIELDGEELLALFARHESAQQRETPDLRYPELLARVLHRMGMELGVRVGEEEAAAFGASVGDWPAFPDAPAALSYLGRHYRLVILSNVDRRSFQASAARLGVRFHRVFTAEDVGSYKPDPRNFDHMLRELAGEGIPGSAILHTAQSLFHDHLPAKRAGLATCWIDRRGGRQGGATPPVAEPVQPDFRFPDLAAMVEAHRGERPDDQSSGEDLREGSRGT